MSEIAKLWGDSVPDTDLVLWIPGSGWDGFDHSRFRHTLTCYGGVIVGNRMWFDGTDDYIDAGAIGNLQQVSMWIDPESTTEEILQIDAGKHITLSGGTVTYTGLTAVATYVDAVAGTTMVADQWQHLVCQFNQDSGANFEIGREGANYGEVDIWNLRAHDDLWSVDEIIEYEAKERVAI
jgi:hypothetical protein